MFIALNLILIVLVGLIAYWWANQGLFSALLHLLCVVVAGAVTLAFWEPLVVRVLLSGGFFDDYAWGVTLVVLFSITLFVLRIMMDKLAPANVQLPNWANLTFGGAAGLASGILTVGILIIGAGHVQSSRTLLGLRGWARSARTGEVLERNRMWMPFHQWTSDFYELLSVSSLSTRRPLRHYAPDLYKQATLVRDTWGGGKGKLSMPPNAVTVQRLYQQQIGARAIYVAKVAFGLGAQDFGEQLTLSSSQVRLIGVASGTNKAPVAHPIAYRQHSGYYPFDNISNYVSSEPGKETAEVYFEFETDADFQPRFIQIRGTRFTLPAPRAAPAELVVGGSGLEEGAIDVPTGGGSIDDALKVANDIRPVAVSLNALPSGISETNRYLSSGEATFPRGRTFVTGKLRIMGIYEPEGTRVVRLNVSRGGPADIFRFADQITDDSTLALVDTLGNEYSPIGYMHRRQDSTTIRLEPATRVRTLDELPILPQSGAEELDLLFYVTEGATLAGFRFGDIDVGTCSVQVTAKR